MTECKSCHWFKDEEPFKILSNGKMYPCSNIGVDGWKHWSRTQTEPRYCNDYCKKGEYVPTGIWASVAKVVEEVGKYIKEVENE